MTELEFFQNHVFFTTREFSLQMNVSVESASRKLNALKKTGAVTLVTRGVWSNLHHSYYSTYGVIPHLLGSEQGYLSFLSALHRHEMISQIPTTIQIASTGKNRKLKSPIGEFHFLQINPKLMRDGIELFDGKLQYNIATPEKALLDTFYIATKRGKRFEKLPEIEFNNFKEKTFRQLLIQYPRISQKVIWDRYLALKKSFK